MTAASDSGDLLPAHSVPALLACWAVVVATMVFFGVAEPIVGAVLALGAFGTALRKWTEFRPDPLLVGVVVLAVGHWLQAPGMWFEQWLGIALTSIAAVVFAGGRIRSTPCGVVAQVLSLAVALHLLVPGIVTQYVVVAAAILQLVVVVLGQPSLRSAPTAVAAASDATAAVSGAFLLVVQVLTGGSGSSVALLFVVTLVALVALVLRLPRLRVMLDAKVQRDLMRTGSAPGLLLDGSGTVLEMNDDALDFFGPSSISGNLADIAADADHVRLLAAIEHARAEGESSVESVSIFAAAEARVATVRIEANVGDGEQLLIASLSDTTDEVLRDRQAEAQLRQLEHQVHTDPLTGIANRARLTDHLEKLLTWSGAVAVFLDLDGFKAVNDVYGHDAGDEVLQVVAKRLKTCFGDPALVGRLGGDEFVMIAPAGHLSQADLETIQQVIPQPIPHNDLSLTVGVSLGYSAEPAGGSASQLLRNADQAMYQNKSERKKRRGAGPREQDRRAS